MGSEGAKTILSAVKNYADSALTQLHFKVSVFIIIIIIIVINVIISLALPVLSRLPW